MTILIDICQAIIRANDNNQLKSNQAFLVKNASIILQASAKLGIRELVYSSLDTTLRKRLLLQPLGNTFLRRQENGQKSSQTTYTQNGSDFMTFPYQSAVVTGSITI